MEKGIVFKVGCHRAPQRSYAQEISFVATAYSL